MMKRIGVIADTFKTYAYFGNKAVAEAQVMVDLDQLRREFPDQARTDAIRKAQAEFRLCMNRRHRNTQPLECHERLMVALNDLLL